MKEQICDKATINNKYIPCEYCNHFLKLNLSDVYGICNITGKQFMPFGVDTRTHSCELSEKRL